MKEAPAFRSAARRAPRYFKISAARFPSAWRRHDARRSGTKFSRQRREVRVSLMYAKRQVPCHYIEIMVQVAVCKRKLSQKSYAVFMRLFSRVCVFMLMQSRH